MKKIFFGLLASLFALTPVIALAASFSLTPNSGDYIAGHSYTVGVYINPAGSTIYTAKVAIDYPPNLLEVTGFTPASNAMLLTQPGYDSTDNASGVLIKTEGFPNGVSSNTLFGTVTFYAKTSGSATVSISSSNSQALNSSVQNVATSFGTASYLITESTPQKTTLTQAAQKKMAVQRPANISKSHLRHSTVAAAAETPTQSAQAATSQVAAAATTGTHVWIWVFWLASVLVAFGLGYALGRKRRD